MVDPGRELGVSGETGTRILDVAERLAQTRGFNGFSYADVAAELGLTKATLHYHYRSKAMLGEALIDRYASRFAAALDAVDTSAGGAPAAIYAYVELYAAVLRGDRMCLCGMFAAEYETLPVAMQTAVRRFFDTNEAWLERVLEQGRRDGSVHFSGSACEEARLLIGGLEGAMLIARSYGDGSRFRVVADRILAGLTQDA